MHDHLLTVALVVACAGCPGSDRSSPTSQTSVVTPGVSAGAGDADEGGSSFAGDAGVEPPAGAGGGGVAGGGSWTAGAGGALADAGPDAEPDASVDAGGEAIDPTQCAPQFLNEYRQCCADGTVCFGQCTPYGCLCGWLPKGCGGESVCCANTLVCTSASACEQGH